MKQEIHILRNPHIYDVFLGFGPVTDAGSGIPRIVRRVKEAVEREPDLRVTAGEFVLTIPRPVALGRGESNKT
jgi:predicted HTH transcriptional regulator